MWFKIKLIICFLKTIPHVKNCRSEILSNGVSKNHLSDERVPMKSGLARSCDFCCHCERISGNFSPAGDFSLLSFLFIVEKKADFITGFIFKIKRFDGFVLNNIAIYFVSCTIIMI